ncbi:MAG: M20/M25/M40 family metallo-hydrolase [bacterium]|nr:M20/M25/M40 family metallo-hydrolase [bacterium]
MTDWQSLLADLTSIPGISGHEHGIAAHLGAALRSYGDDVTIDPVFNLTARIGSGERKIAVCAHLDTIGMMVKRIHADDTLGVVRIGGINYKSLPGTAVRIHTDDGDVAGVVGVRSAHQARPGDEAIKSDDEIYVETGQAANAIEITTPITYAPYLARLGESLISAPYLDDRAGCAVLVALAARLKAAPSPHTVYLVGTVQEETNAMGAHAALAAIQPDAAIFIDGTVSYDTPETRGRGDVRLGAGPVLTAFLYISGIGSWHAHPLLRQHIRQAAHRAGIAFQQDAVHGLMADSRAALPLGIPSAVIGLPMRGKHSAAEIVDTADLDTAVNLLHAVLSQPFPNLSPG